MLQQKFTVQVTTLPYCDDITRFDGTIFNDNNENSCKLEISVLEKKIEIEVKAL
jgi:hypothetical protein